MNVERIKRLLARPQNPLDSARITRTRCAAAHLSFLAAHHYRGKPPAVADEALILSTQDAAGDDQPIGILITSFPTLNDSWRADSPGSRKRADAPEQTRSKKKARAAAINQSTRTIARIIIHPAWRALGAASMLVDAYLAQPATPHTEAVAAMGRICPLFQRAGMKTLKRRATRRDRRLINAAHALKLRASIFRNHRKLARLLLEHEPLAQSARAWLNDERPRHRNEPCATATPPSGSGSVHADPPIALNEVAFRIASHFVFPPQVYDIHQVPSAEEPRAEQPAPKSSRSSAADIRLETQVQSHIPDPAPPTAAASPHPQHQAAQLPLTSHAPQPPAAKAQEPTVDSKPLAHVPLLRPAQPASSPRPHAVPATADQLHDWIRANLGLTIARKPIVEGHAAPFDYLLHAFFEGRAIDPRTGAPDLARPPTPDCIVWASRGGGKTFLAAVATLLDVVFKPAIEIRLLGGSKQQSSRIYAHLLKLLNDSHLIDDVVKGPTADGFTFGPSGARVEILAQSETSVRGIRVQKLRCDEVELFSRDLWAAAQLTTISMNCPGPWGRTVGGAVEALSTMHQPFGLVQSLVDADAARRVFCWGVLDCLAHCTDEHDCRACPLHHDCKGRAKLIPPAESGHLQVRDAVNMIRRVGRDQWASEMLCLRPRRSDCIYHEFSDSLHVLGAPDDDPRIMLARALDRGARLVGGIDFASRGSTAIVLGTLDDADALTMFWSYERAGEAFDIHLDELERFLARIQPARGAPADSPARASEERPARASVRPHFIGIDPAGAALQGPDNDSYLKRLRARNFITRHKSARIPLGISFVKARLAPADQSLPRLFVHASCTRLIECLRLYHYNPDKPADHTPVKDGFDHTADALRYLVTNIQPAAAVKKYI